MTVSWRNCCNLLGEVWGVGDVGYYSRVSHSKQELALHFAYWKCLAL